MQASAGAEEHDIGLAYRRQMIDGLLTTTYDSLIDVEQQALDNEATKDLTLAEIHTIDAIGVGGRFPMNVIATRTGVTLGTLTTTVNRLVGKGYVDRARCESDRRQVLIGLTSKGRTAYRVHRHFHNQLIDQLTDGLSVEQQEALIGALENMDAYFDSVVKPSGKHQGSGV